MKYRVIGWAGYDDAEIEDGDCSYAAVNAIIDDIRENGYSFSGYSHQEMLPGAPILNDGKRRCFSQREWGSVMAEAHGMTGSMDYCHFLFYAGDDEKMPSTDVWISASDIEVDKCLDEEIFLEIPHNVYEKTKNDSEYLGSDCELFRFLDVGDRLTLKCGDDGASYSVKALCRGWNFGCGGEIKPVFPDEMNRILYCGSDEEKKFAEKIYSAGTNIIRITLEP